METEQIDKMPKGMVDDCGVMSEVPYIPDPFETRYTETCLLIPALIY